MVFDYKMERPKNSTIDFAIEEDSLRGILIFNITLINFLFLVWIFI